ncbi:MAG: glutathione transferase [Gammaproteobacteria bacterium]
MPAFTLHAEDLWISPYVFSSFVALREKGVPFAVETISLAGGDQHRPAYRDVSLTARVPALTHGGFHLCESSAIAEYLEEILPPPAHPALLPADPRSRARARQVMAWLRTDLGALRTERATVRMFYRFGPQPLSAAAQADVDKLVRIAGALVGDGAGHLFGPWSLADSEMAFMLQRLVLNGDPLPALLRDYAVGQWQRASVREFAGQARPASIPEHYWQATGTPRPAPT